MRQYEEDALISAPPEKLFTYVDDHARFSVHMSRRSWMMGGGRMDVSMDEEKGRTAGSHIRLSGTAFGIRLSVDEVITRYESPFLKEWETVGTPKLLVIGRYRMRIEIQPRDGRSFLRVSIDYDLPTQNVWLGRLFGNAYAKWCVRQMIQGAQNQFMESA